MIGLISSNLLRRPGRTLLTALGVAVGVATIVALLALTQGLRDTAAGLVHLGGGDLGVFQSNVSDPTASVLPASLVTRLGDQPYVARATPLVLLVSAVTQDPAAIVFGAQTNGFFAQRLIIESGQPLRAGAAVVGDRLAAELHLHPGSRLAVDHHPLLVAGIYHSGVLFEDQGAVTDLATAQAINGHAAEETDVVVQLAAGTTLSAARADITRNFPGTQAIADADDAARSGANNVLISKAILAIVVIALIVGGIGVTNTASFSVLERRSEFGLLAAVGWSSLRVALLVLGEGIGTSLLGAMIGLVLGVAGSAVLVQALGIGGYISPSITAWALAEGLLVGVAIGVFGGIYPAWRVTRMRPARALSRG